MKIQKVIIDNFRNIKHAEYDLKDMNIFAGPNGTGKSNTLLAIYWLMNDYLLDGSSDDASNKPTDRDQKTKTSVELIFEDGWSIKKDYWENWVKKQATKEVVMEGNLTQYYVRGDKVNVKEAREQLRERLGSNTSVKTSDINLSLALSDPTYIGDKVDSKTLRSFIINLVGDVHNEDVFTTDSLFKTVEPLIEKYDDDPSLVIKSLKKKIKKCKDDIESKEGAIESLSEIVDVSSEELKNANDSITKIDETIALYRDQKVNSVNKQVVQLEKEFSQKELELANSIKKDSAFLSDTNSKVNEFIKLKRNELETKKTDLTTANNSMWHADHQIKITQNELKKLQEELKTKEERLVYLREEYQKIKDSKFESNIEFPKETKCPNCEFLLNSDAFESIREIIRQNERDFFITKDKRIDDNVTEGKSLGLDIENIKLNVSELEKSLVSHLDNFKNFNSEVEITGKFVKRLEDELQELTFQLINHHESENTKKLKSEVDMIKQKLELEKQSDNSQADIDNKILIESEKKIFHREIISKHDVYIQTQNEITRITNEIDRISSTQTEYEQQLAIVSDFMKTKLSMLTKNVESVFGTKVKFTLVKANIKEGSWEEVCYPSVLDKDTAFIRGSESERIRTGIYMIECIKKKLNIPDVPIIFDRSNDLDSTNLKGLETKSQIITTRVDDVNFKEVTLVHA